MKTSCLYCHVDFSSQTKLRNHYLDSHPTETPFSCETCHKRYKHYNGLQRHLEKNICTKSTSTESIDDDDMPRPSLKRKKILPRTQRFEELASYAERLGNTGQSFTEWAVRYRFERLRDDPPLAETTETRILDTERSLGVIDWTYPQDTIDEWLDDQYSRGILPITVVTRLRHVLWLARWKLSNLENFSMEVIAWLQDTIHDAQSRASISQTSSTSLALLDPYQMAHLRDTLVKRLREEQHTVLDPFIDTFVKYHDTSTLLAFGLQLRCWIDLAMRFLCVPLRMQCTIHLVEPSGEATDYVSKLCFRQDHYVRIINRDKCATSHAPTEVPISHIVSLYLAFYRRHCRPNPLSPYTFQTIRGGQWVRASKDVKDYMQETLGVNPDSIEPNGRFVHGSRHIGLAVYALANNFDTEALRDLAHLMRHTSATAERYYSLWSSRHQNERAALRFTTSVGQENETTVDPSPPYKPVTLGLPNVVVRVFLKKLFSSECPVLGEEVGGGLCDVSTQTGEDHSAEPPKAHLQAPRCKTCDGWTSVLGPVGTQRDVHVGCYYMQCIQCHGKRTGKHTLYYFPLGFLPPTRTHSNKPRVRINSSTADTLDETGSDVSLENKMYQSV